MFEYIAMILVFTIIGGMGVVTTNQMKEES